MVLHDLSRSTITNQIAFDQRDLHSTPEFERAMDHRCQAQVSKLTDITCLNRPQIVKLRNEYKKGIKYY